MNANVTNNKFVNEWIAEMADLVNPSEIILIDGSAEQTEARQSRLRLFVRKRVSLVSL